METGEEEEVVDEERDREEGRRTLSIRILLARQDLPACDARDISSLSGPNARNIDARVPRPIFIILPRPIFLIDKFRQSIIRRLSFRIVLARFF